MNNDQQNAASHVTVSDLPQWLREPLLSFLNRLIQLEAFYHLTARGLQMFIFSARRIEELTEQVTKLRQGYPQPKEEEARSKELLDRAKEDARYASKEVDRGFPTLHSQVVISLWSTLEWFIEDTLTCLLANLPELWQIEEVKKVRIPLADYNSLTPEERCRYVVELIERDIGAPLRQGIDRFESLLRLFRLGGEVPDPMRKNLYELTNVRNVFVHRGGLADRRFVQACPWLSVSVGQPLQISSADFHRYFDSVCGYEDLIVDRIKKNIAQKPGGDQPLS